MKTDKELLATLSPKQRGVVRLIRITFLASAIVFLTLGLKPLVGRLFDLLDRMPCC
jgi:hypothetical protein